MVSIRIERARLDDVPEVQKGLSETWRATYSSFLSEATINKVTSVWHRPDRLAVEAGACSGTDSAGR